MGFNEAPEGLGAALTLGLLFLLGLIVWRLYSTGYGLRE